MDVEVLAASALAGVAAAAAASRVVPVTRRLAPATRPYSQLARSRLGRPADVSLVAGAGPVVSGRTVARVFGPIAASAVAMAGRVIDVADDTEVALRLRQAGLYELAVADYRIRQLGWAVGSAVVSGLLGVLWLQSAAGALLGMALGAVYGASRWGAQVSRTIRLRRERMRTELYTVAQLLAMMIRAGMGPGQALRTVVAEGRGPVVEELAMATRAISRGESEAVVLERLAAETPEPAAARLYRVLGSAIALGADLVEALLAVADDLRAARREDVERRATVAKFKMMFVVVGVMAPVMLLFLAFPLVRTIFGGTLGR